MPVRLLSSSTTGKLLYLLLDIFSANFPMLRFSGMVSTAGVITSFTLIAFKTFTSFPALMFIPLRASFNV